MVQSDSKLAFAGAIQDFRRARRQAVMQQVLSRLAGRSDDALSYEEVRQALKIEGRKPPKLQDIPLDAIVGSVGRYTDFTRSFLPKQSVSEERWAGVKVAATGLIGLPPIDVYQIGEAYFVADGNHRVSVARELGASHIEAYVTELQTNVALTPDDRPDDVILKAEYAAFLERTRLKEVRPEADLRVTVPGRLHDLEEHIQVHRYYMGLEQRRNIPYREAVAGWYDTVYWPVVRVIRERGILRDFPERTETDLYVWAAKYRAELMAELGWEVAPVLAAADLPSQADSGVRRAVATLGERVLGAVGEDQPGRRRRERSTVRQDDRLFTEVLVPLSGEVDGWPALEQALAIAQREGSQIRGLHVVPAGAESESDRGQAMRAEFARRCNEAGVSGQLVLAHGRVRDQICKRAWWTDLVVLSLKHPPPPQVMAKLSSGFRTILRRCAGPVLAVPGAISALHHPLLAYDGSAKAQEGLFVATYLAGRWHLPLTVVMVLEGGHASMEAGAQAREYLTSRGIVATFVQEEGPVAEAILRTAGVHDNDLIITGGYGRSPLLEVALGSAVDHLLRTSRWPVLICQ
jgi:nucleotide-binding universal stress UspA family protein